MGEKIEFCSRKRFSFEFCIKFTESPTLTDEERLSTGKGRGRSFLLSVQGRGTLEENRDFVVLRIRKDFDTMGERHVEESARVTFICRCDLNILDVEGHKRLPRIVYFLYDSDDIGEHEDRYLERSCILNSALEYLQEDTLTVSVEVIMLGIEIIFLEQGSYYLPRDFHYFHVEQLERELKVYIPNDSVHYHNLLKYSAVFSNMMKYPMLESCENRVPLRNEELPAFLCMLVFIETKILILHEATISDMYKIAHMYDIAILLEICRKHAVIDLPRNPSAILEFATHYYDTELMRIAKGFMESYSCETPECNDNLEMEGEFVWDTLPVHSNLISTENDFEIYLGSLLEKFQRETTIQMFKPSAGLPKMETEREQFDFYQ